MDRMDKKEKKVDIPWLLQTIKEQLLLTIVAICISSVYTFLMISAGENSLPLAVGLLTFLIIYCTNNRFMEIIKD